MNRILPKIQAGFSLLEVLVSVVVLAVGLLGIAALQSKAIEYNHSAYLRSIAVAQINAMLDRMKANYPGVRRFPGVRESYYHNINNASNPNCNPCNSAQLAQKDVYEWNITNAQLLPSGQGTIQSNGDLHVLTIRWDNNRTGATGLNCSGDPDVDLTCLTMEVKL